MWLPIIKKMYKGHWVGVNFPTSPSLPPPPLLFLMGHNFPLTQCQGGDSNLPCSVGADIYLVLLPFEYR